MTADVSEHMVRVTFTGDEGVPNREDVFTVLGRDDEDAKSEALSIAGQAWGDLPSRFGMTLGVFRAEVLR